MNIIQKIVFPTEETTIQVMFPVFAKFLVNYDNTLYFEAKATTPEDKLEENIFYILRYRENLIKPTLSEYLCSYTVDNETYFVFKYIKDIPFTSFGKNLFGGF